MKKFKSLRSWMASALVITSLTMCHKKEKETDLAPNSTARMGVEAVSTCTNTISTTQSVVDGSSIPAGSVVCISSGTRGPLTLRNFHGTASNPITFINKGGKVVFQVDQAGSYALKTDNCSHFKFLGSGDPSYKYGFEVNGSHNGMSFDHLTTDFELAYVEVHNTGFAGIMAKTDPSCDPATWRGHFVMQNISVHDNYVHNTGGEGFYLGNSFYQNGRNLTCGVILPHEVWNIKVYNNITSSTGCEGIQVGCATRGCEIYNNSVTSPGQSPFANAQSNGIQMGEGTGGKCHNNIVKNSPDNGIIVLGIGDNIVYNNYIINSGQSGIFCDERYTPGNNFKFINNTIINPKVDGIRLYSDVIPMNTVINNVFVNPGSGKAIFKVNNNVKVTDLNNYVTKDINTCKFVNASACDFRVNSGSPLIDKGYNAGSYGIMNDYNGVGRPMNNVFDIGATEYKYGSSTTTSPTPAPAPSPSPSPSPAPSTPGTSTTTTMSVMSCTLLNATTGAVIGSLYNGVTVDLAKTGTNKLVVRANTNPGTVGSVLFGYDSRASFKIENGAAPYTLMGDYPGNIYVAWIPSIGKHTITATPYSAANATGTKGKGITITINVINSAL